MLNNKLTLFYHYEQNVGDVIIKMFLVCISHDVKCSSARGGLGQYNISYIFRCHSGSHLLKKPGQGLPDWWIVSGSGCCTGLGTSPVDGVCGYCGVCTTDFLGVCGVVAGATRVGGVPA